MLGGLAYLSVLILVTLICELKNNLIKFISKRGDSFEVQLGDMINLLSKFVSQETLAPTLMDN